MSYGETLGIVAELRQLKEQWAARAPRVLRGTRPRMGWSQYVMACKLGTNRVVVSELERGRRPTTPKMIERLARVMEAEQQARGKL